MRCKGFSCYTLPFDFIYGICVVVFFFHQIYLLISFMSFIVFVVLRNDFTVYKKNVFSRNCLVSLFILKCLVNIEFILTYVWR